jgi:hypothetical protein
MNVRAKSSVPLTVVREIAFDVFRRFESVQYLDIMSRHVQVTVRQVLVKLLVNNITAALQSFLTVISWN